MERKGISKSFSPCDPYDVVENLNLIKRGVLDGLKKLGVTPEDVGLTFEDLVQEGVIAYVEARERFDEKRGVKFSTFVYYRIIGAVTSAVRKELSERKRRILILNDRAEGKDGEGDEILELLGCYDSFEELVDLMEERDRIVEKLEKGEYEVVESEGADDGTFLRKIERRIKRLSNLLRSP